MDENQLQLVRDALKTVDRYKDNPNEFMKQLVENQFSVGNKKTIWDHFNVLTSLSPTFQDRYKKTVLRDYKVPNRKFWKDYVGRIEGFIYYVSQVPGERSVILDKALQSYAQSGGLSAEQMAQMQSMPLNQRMDAIDQLLQKKRGQQAQYYGHIPNETSKGIEGSKSIIAERKFGIQGSKSIAAERKVLTESEEKPLTTGLEVLRADESSNESNRRFPSFGRRRILTPEAQEARNQAFAAGEHELRMGLIKGGPALENAIGTFTGDVVREIASLESPERNQGPIFVEQVPTTYQGSSSRGSGVHIPTRVNVPKALRRARKTSTAVRNAELVAKQLATKNPIFWIVALVVLIIILLLFFGSDSFHIVQNTALCGLPNTPCGKTPSQTVETTNNVAILKSAPISVNQGADIAYNISVTYTGAGVADLEVTDTVPGGTTYQSYSPADPKTTSKVGDTITWELNNVSTNTPQIFFLTVTAPNSDTWVQNTATVKILRTSINPGGDLNTPPNQNNCNGEWGPNSYFGRFPQHGNFGDPNCDFSRDALFSLLTQQDPINASYWFNTVVRCESGYDPNAFLAASTSGKGAYGLFQMNPSGQGNGPLDAGNVVWQQQVLNAVGYENMLANRGVPWTYWACASNRW